MGKSSPQPSKPKVKKSSKSTAKAPKPSSERSSAGNGSKKDQILHYMFEQHVMNMEEVNKMDVGLAVGYKNPRSAGFLDALKELMTADGPITKGRKKDTLTLTENGIQSIPKDIQISDADPSKVHDRYIELLEKKVKGGKDKIRPLWEQLMDRQSHKINDIATKLGYGNPRSFGNTKIINTMKEIGVIEDAGKRAVKFTDKIPSI